MKEAKLDIFINSAAHYFTTISKTKACIGNPVLIPNINDYLFDFTGIIRIFGSHRGNVFFTAPEKMLAHILSDICVQKQSENSLLDLVGEVSNTLSGNARKEFGDEFMLSTPIALTSKTTPHHLRKMSRVYLIPIVWRHVLAHLIISLDTD